MTTRAGNGRQLIVPLAIGLGGAIGALGRYAVAQLLPTVPGRYPWSTFWVNISGSAALGFVLVLMTERFSRAGLARLVLATGIIGAYTTFSTFVVEADLLVRDGKLVAAGAYCLGSLGAGLMAGLAGMAAARLVLRTAASMSERG